MAEEITPWLLKPSIILAFSTVLVLIYATYLRALPKPIPGIPYNAESAQRLSGDIPHLMAILKSGKRPREFWADLSRKHNSAITQFFTGPFTKPGVVIWDFREMQDLLLRRSKDLDRGTFNNDMWSGAIPHHFIAMDTRDPRFANARQLQKDLMTPTFLHKVSAPASYQKVLKLIELWQFKAELSNGLPFKAIEDLNCFTADVIFAAALGIEDAESNTVQYLERLRCAYLSGDLLSNSETSFSFPDHIPDRLLQSILVLAPAIGQAPTAPSQKLYWKFTNLRPAIRKAHKDRQQILQMHIDRASLRVKQCGSEVRHHAAVDYMVTRELAIAEKVGRKPILDSPLFHDMLFGYCLGGQDTTHSVLSFLVKRLGVHQAIQSTLRTHLQQAYAPALAQRRNPTQEEITKSHIPYLDAFIEEVLRCDSPSPFVIKETLTDMPILGAVVPKGSMLFFPLFGRSINEPAYAIPESIRSDTSQKHCSMTPLDWSGSEFAPHEFHVERWLRNDPSTGSVVFDSKAGPFMTFGTGNRECWGKRLAYLQLKLITTLLVWKFKFLPLTAELDDFEATDILNAKPKTCFVSLKNI